MNKTDVEIVDETLTPEEEANIAKAFSGLKKKIKEIKEKK